MFCMGFVSEAQKEAIRGVKKNQGGPFGAVIVRKDKIIARAHNTVVSGVDPTAHAEINVIRKAAKKLKTFDLSDCELYSSCEPCPMCISAIYWARIKKVYYVATRLDAAKAGFDDANFYEMFSGKQKSGTKLVKVNDKNGLEEFHVWAKKQDKKRY
jgi:guanine deaminase